MKVLTWLGKIVISSVLITTITMFTTWYVVNMYVEDIFRQYQIPALGKKIQFSDFTARLAEDLNIVMRRDGGKQATPVETPPAATPSPSPSPSGSVPGSNSSDPLHSDAGTSGEAASQGVKDDDAVAVMGRVSDANEQKKELVMSTEDFAKKKEALSSDDKMKIFSLVVAKLPQNEVQHLSALLEDGITTDELKQVNDTLKKYLNETELQQLTAILNKY
ncbi:hypothetical protein HZF08_26785 [Paenibacillus sp. CGMCC 1.16610]|uniref:Uncharacterized protein n=1 Tax=Paenibacillus anseongense TaxID=2682845 RepID=A0ABW9U4T9_9BACL|nr:MULTISPECIES: hypothetical protein [Paenibacillus]MBA2941899.1 hypothetical protein [Paenibacillus sp. CGMCC 1.16610]MVQ34417.1 hypothetical protein [Paenibacillus anseongense]